MATHEKPDFVLETPIATTAAKLWAALTDGQHTKKYHFAHAEVKSDLKVGSRFEHCLPDGSVMIGGEILAIDPPKRLELTFEPGFAGPDAPHSRCTYEIAENKDGCVLTILHYGIPAGQEGIADGWGKVAASVKAYLETGKEAA